MTKYNIALLLGLMAASSQAFAPQTVPQESTTSLMATQDGENTGAMGRRIFGQGIASSAAVVAGSTMFPEFSEALPKTGRPKKTLEDDRVFFKGKVNVQNGIIPPEVQNAKNKALIVTARPKNAASVPPEVKASAGGKVPAVFTAIVPNPESFPQSFKLTSRDITPEGDFGLSGDPYWWADEPEWEISARVDTDGSLRTLDQSDLVGRTITSKIGEDKPVNDIRVSVQKRGFFGSYSQRKQSV